MNDTAIHVENLGKAYRIERLRKPTDTLRDQLADWYHSTRHGAPASESDAAPNGNGIWALKNVSFDIQRGQVVGILGRNGAGKSTLLKILSRITEPTTGLADIYGRVGSLLEVATGFHPELTGRENIFLNGAIMGMRQRETARRFDEIVAFAEIDRFIDTPVKRYSSGMYTRLAFAVAAHLQSEILLIDEVLAVGDAAFQKKCLGKIGEVAQDGRTILFVSHNMAAIQSLCRQGIVLQNGQVVLQDQADRAINYYLRLNGTVPPNDLRNRLDRRGSGRVRLVNCRFLNEAIDDVPGALLSGMPLLIEIEFEKRATDPADNVDVCISLYSEFGALMFACKSSARGTLFRLDRNSGRLCCRIPRLPLSSGVYSFNLSCEVNGVLSDSIRDAGQITVEAGDYYGTGKLPTGEHPSVFIDYDWLSHPTGR